MSRLIAVFAVASFVFTAASVPFSAIVGLFELDRVGISYARAEGTLWRGHLSDVYWRDAPVGQVMIRPVLSALLSGKFSLAFVVDGRVVEAEGKIVWGLFSQFRIQDVRLSADLAALPVFIKLGGRLDLALTEIEFGAGGCKLGKGRLHTDALTHSLAGLAWSGPALTGEIRCDDGVLILPLSGGDAAQDARLLMQVKPDHKFDVRVDVDILDPVMTQLLPQFGFYREGGTLVLKQEGRWD